MSAGPGAETRQPISETSGPGLFAQRRGAAAGFWLSLLFRLTSRAPGLVRAARPVFVPLAFAFSAKIRRGTRANARWLLPGSSSDWDRRAFGLRVTGAFYDFIQDIGLSLRQTREELAARIESADGEEAYRKVRRQKKGAILLTAHMGSFEVGLVALAANEPRIHVVFKRDDVSAFERLRGQLRRRLQISEAAVDDGWAVWLRLRDALRNDEVVAIQGDRAMPGQKGLKSQLLGGHVILPTGPFKLALATGSPIVPIFSIRTRSGGIRIFLEEAIEVSADAGGIADAVRKFAEILARYIQRHPDQWLVLDRAFCEDIESAGL